MDTREGLALTKMCFYTHDTVFCPVCEPVRNKRGDQINGRLECTCHNYSGCSVDFGECPDCGRRFEVSYKVAEIIEIE